VTENLPPEPAPSASAAPARQASSRRASSRPALGSNLDTVRQHNLGTLLRLVHGTSGRSRSELTRLTGLSRSTIGALVAGLVALGLVEEIEPQEPTGVGRPSPIVRARADIAAVTINPDVDGVALAVLGLDGTLHHHARHATAAPPSARDAARIAGRMLEAVRREHPALRLVGLGAAVPGAVRSADGVVRLAPHLEWTDEPFAAMLAEETGLPARVANDASLGAAAEHLFGAGRGIDDLVYLNGGSGGIGGGVITGGVALTGSAGYAGELGHTLVASHGIRCHCGAIGCLETEVSQARLVEALALEDTDDLDAALASLREGTLPEGALPEASLPEGTLPEGAVRNRSEVGAAASVATSPATLGDRTSGRVEAERQLRALAVGIRTAVNIFNPRRVVLGGFLGALMASSPGLLDAEVRAQSLEVAAELVDIVRAELGPEVLTVGAAELAFAALLENPGSVQA
jgi:predicted NBD/HSP70 family sugar kinase